VLLLQSQVAPSTLGKYYYQFVQVDFDGNQAISGTCFVDVDSVLQKDSLSKSRSKLGNGKISKHWDGIRPFVF